MRQPDGNWLLMRSFAGALAACTSSKEVPVDPNLFPTSYKQEILDTLSHTLVDPTNIRNASISDPALTPVDKEQRYTSCVRYTARDASRQYGAPTRPHRLFLRRPPQPDCRRRQGSVRQRRL